MQTPMNLLLVDDSSTDIRLTRSAVKQGRFDCTLITVNSEFEAMQYLNGMRDACIASLPDIILINLSLSNQGGHAVLSSIKSDDVLSGIPVILISLSKEDEKLIDVLNLSMDFFLARELSSADLCQLIEAVLNLDQEQMAHDLNDIVRMSLSGNSSCPEHLLQELIWDANIDISLSASKTLNNRN